MLRRDFGGPPDVGGQGLLVVDDLHAAAAQHVGRSDQDRVADLVGDELGLGEGPGQAVLRGREIRLGEHPAERPALLGEVDGLGAGADDRHAGVLERLGQPQRGLAAELDDHPGHRSGRPLGVHHLEHVLQGERLEVEPVGGVVVGGDGLRVAVDHDRLVARSGQRHRGVHAGVVELDALADPVGTTAEDQDGGLGPRYDLGLGVVGAVVVGRTRRELGGAGVDGLVDRAYAEGPAHPADHVLAEMPQTRRSGRRTGRAAWPCAVPRRSARGRCGPARRPRR